MRVFIALELPLEIIEEIKKIQKLIWKKTLFSWKLTESENLHLTLKFLGEIEDLSKKANSDALFHSSSPNPKSKSEGFGENKIEEVKKKLGEIKLNSFEAFVGEVGVFSRKFIKIIWIKLNGKGVFSLQKEIDEKLKDLFKPEERFMSHITIARVKYVNDKKGLLNYLKSVKPEAKKFKIEKFFLKKSELKPEGPVYEDLEEYKLEIT